ncbi:DEAD/DEAH box helicase family protein [Halomonas elongata]|uniref:LPD38 domain-containing protein n=1 Tax=Halomonas elongata TaxID=2746 RepID=UPI003346D6F4
MAGPWEKYQQPEQSQAAEPSTSGPWTRYQSEQPETTPRGLDMGPQEEKPDTRAQGANGPSGPSGEGQKMGLDLESGAGQQNADDRIRASDYGLETLEGGVRGVGSAVGGTGDFLEWGGNLVESGLRKLGLGDVVDAGDEALSGMAPSDAFQKFESWMQEGANQVDESQSESFRKAMEESTPQGDVFDPGSWSFGDDPSVAGYGAQMAGLIGQFAPQAATMLAGSPQRVATAMTLMGGAQAGGSQANEAEKRIESMDEGQLTESSGLYKDLRDKGMSHEEAQKQTAKAAGAAAFVGGAPAGAAGGAITSYVLGPLQRQLGGSLGGRMANSVALEGPAEATQEVSETMLARQNTNTAIQGQQDLDEGTFGDAVLGGMFGTGLGAAGALGGGRDATPPRTPNDAVRERTPEDQAALNEQFEREQQRRYAEQSQEPAGKPEPADVGTSEDGNPAYYRYGDQEATEQAWRDAWAQEGAETDVTVAGEQPSQQPMGLQLPDSEEKVRRAASRTNTEPTPAQAEAGNYRKGKVRLDGLDVAIENPKGSTRSGTDPDGREWESTMAHHYGDIKGTVGADGDNLDVFVGDRPENGKAFVIDQVNDDGSFDEHKVMLGFDSVEEAREGYLANYEEGWQGLGEISEVSTQDLKSWMRDGDTRQPFALPQQDGQGLADESTEMPEGQSQPVEPPEVSEIAPPDSGMTPSRVPVEKIEVDPDEYQFRTEVNDQGVDARLEGVEQWDDLRAGNLLLHEREDGRIFAADGHHRVDLARRLEQPDVNAMVLRERDGVSVEDARRIAAETNIADGNASATDAAKVFRNSDGDPKDVIHERNLPRRSQVVRDGADLAKLGDEPFGAVLNQVVSEKDGAAIGRAFDDPEQQRAAVDVFRRVQPQNENQRALLVNEVRQAGFADTQGEQGGLFGDDPMESLVGERVKVMDRLRQDLMRDRRLFATLNNNADRAQQAGNRIATDQNEAFQDASARAINLLERATTTPEINQQINDAARRVNEGQSVADAARDLKEVLLRGNESATTEPDRSPAPSSGQAQEAGLLERGDQPVPGSDNARATGAGEQRESRTGREEPAVTFKADGKPFPTRRAVQLSKRFRDTPGAEPVEVEGGWGFVLPDKPGQSTQAGTEQSSQDSDQKRRPVEAASIEEDLSSSTPRGREGDLKGQGETWRTAGGRDTTPFPKVDVSTERKARNTRRRADQWLIDNAQAEARSRGDNFNLRQFEQLRADNMSPADQESAEMYLFGDEQPSPVRSALRDLRDTTRHQGDAAESNAQPRSDLEMPEIDQRPAQPATEPTRRQRRSAEELGGIAQGDTIKLNTDVGYARAGEEYRVNTIQRDGQVHVTGTRGGSTTLSRAELTRASNMVNGPVAERVESSSPLLETQTEESLARREDEIRQAEQAEAERRRQEDQRAQADAEVDDFRLTGSDSEADIAASYGQGDMLGAQPDVTSDPDTAVEQDGQAGDPSSKRGWGESNTLVSQERAEEIRQRLRAKLGQLNSGIDPEIMALGTELAAFHLEAGARRFSDFARTMARDLGASVEDIRPYLRSWYNGGRDMMEDSGLDVAGMDGPDEVRQALNELTDEGGADVSGAGQRSQRDSGESATEDAVGGEPIQAGPRRAPRSSGESGRRSGSQRRARSGSAGVSEDSAGAGRAGGDNRFHRANGEYGAPGEPAGRDDARRSDNGDDGGAPLDPGTSQDVARHAEKVAESVETAEPAPKISGDDIVPASPANIAETLPQLMPSQQEDVDFAEKRFFEAEGRGVLFANGTGTGKTFTGLGIAKRFEMMGRNNILFVVPSDKIASDWVKSGQMLDMDIARLRDTKDNGGSGPVITTYANFRANNSLSLRDWDLIVPDEAHHFLQRDAFEETGALRMFRALTGYPGSARDLAEMQNPGLVDQISQAKARHDAARETLRDADRPEARVEEQEASEALSKLYREIEAITDGLEETRRQRWDEKEVLAAFLSATPFAYRKSIDWANGFLFDYAEGQAAIDGQPSYNEGDYRERFFMENFGYRMRTNKLTEPEGEVDLGLMERNFNQRLKDAGAMRARMLEVDHDYDRRFQLVADGIGTRIDEGLEWLRDRSSKAREQARSGDERAQAEAMAWSDLEDRIRKRFDYLSRSYLLEAIKAKHAIPYIRQHLDQGRKVVVFHGFNKGGGFHPFRPQAGEPNSDQFERLKKERPDLYDLDLTGLQSPLDALSAAFGDRMVQFNGTITSKKTLRDNIEVFNQDGSGKDVIAVQSDKGGAGISLHDTTGQHQRVLINLGLPVKPTAAIQIEGRIYRVGVQSNAIQRYMSTGLSMERSMVAEKLAERSGTAENLAMGNQARALKDNIVEAYENADDFPAGMPGEGQGGKRSDREAAEMSDFDRARTYYFGQQKRDQRLKSREGTDYFATPEPVGLKMVEWAGIRPGDDVLEPSAGHGAIARWIPEGAQTHAVEPSYELASRLLLSAGHAKVYESSFEDLAKSNKYDSIVMNPPFGLGGSTAIAHLDRAFSNHLRNNGRVVALIPTGPAADKRFDKWLEGAENVAMVADVQMPAATFERAATNASTRIVVMDKVASAEGRAPTRSIDLRGADTINDLFDSIEGIDIPRIRPEPEATQGSDVPAAPEPTETTPSEAPGFETAETTHAKKGIDLYVAKLTHRLDRDSFNATREVAKKHGGYWSSYKRQGAIPGFQFESAEDRQAFLDEVRSQTEEQRFSTRSERPATPPSADAVRAELETMRDLMGDVEVIDHPRELPEHVLMGMALQGTNPQDVRGLYSGNRLYVIASNNDSIEAAVRTAVHEAVGHKGIRGVLGSELEPVMRQLFRRLPHSKIGREARDEVKRDYPFLDWDNPDDQVTIAEEMVAHLIEKGHRPAAWQRAVAKIKELLRRYFPSVPWTTADVLELGERARDYLRRRQSEQAQPTVARYSLQAESLFRPIVEEAEAYRRELDRAVKSLKSRVGPIKMGRTPPVLARLGAPDLPITIMRDVVRKATNGVKHDVDMRTIEQLPELLHDPVAVFRSKTEEGAFTILVDATDQSGRPVMVAMHMQKREGRLEVNRVASAYGRERASDFGNWLRDGLGLYLNKEKNPDLVRLIGVRFPGSGSPIQGLSKSVLTPDDVGKASGNHYAMRRRTDTSRISDEFSDLDADQAEALDMIGPLGVAGSAMAKVREAWDRAGVKLRAGLTDKYAALKELDEKAHGRDFIETSTASSSWILARMAPAAQGALHTLIHNGRIQLDANEKVIELKNGEDGGLHAVLAQLGDAAEVSRFMGWIAGNRAEQLAIEGRENYFDPRHIRGLMELNNGRAKNGEARRTLYPRVYEQFQAIRDDVLSIAEQSGLLRRAMSEPESALTIARQYGAPDSLIRQLERANTAMSQEDGDLLDQGQALYNETQGKLQEWLWEHVQSDVQPDALDTATQRYESIMDEWGNLQRDQREIWAEEFYVPFYRVLDENTNDVQGPASTVGLTRQRAYQRLKGADMRIGDLLENSLMNFHHLLSASLKNQAAMQAIDNAEQLGIAHEVPASNRDPKTSTFILRNGQQVYYEINDDLVYKALVNMTDTGMQALMNSSGMKVMRWFKRLLTNAVTVTPEFVAANTLRDSLQSAAVTPAGLNPVWNALRGGAHYARKQNRAQMVASGASFNFGHLYGDRSDELKAQLRRNLKRAKVIDDPGMALQAVKWSWRRWNEATEFAENINRAKVYQSNLDKGKLYAAFQARDLMDFSNHGSWFMTRFLIDTVPFLNARIQGLDKLYRDGFKPTLLTAFGKGSESDRMRAKRFSVVTGALVAASVGLFLHNDDDEDYQALPEWQKDTYWFFKFGDQGFFLPKPFEVGAIATMAERMAQQFTDESAGGDLFKERLWHMISQTFAFSPVPQAAAPILDIYANRDPFRGRPIEPYWDQQLSPSLRFRSSTTMQSRALSQGLETVLGDDSMLTLSPLQLDYLVNGYLGTVGSYAMGMADTMWRRAKGMESPASYWTESKPIRRFYRNLATPAYYTRYQDLFYEGLKEADRVYADLKQLEEMGAIEEARERAQNKGDLLRLRKQLNDARRELSEINKRMDKVKQSEEMDADYKRRELERLRTVRNRITEVLGKEVEEQMGAG